MEFAVTAPIVFFLLLVTMLGGLGVFRYQQVAGLARAGSRWASVHGTEYEVDTGNPAATPQDIYTEAILPAATGMDRSKLSYKVTWNQSNSPLQVVNDVANPKGNTVTVTVTYRWLPSLLGIGPFSLSSSSTAQMAH